MKKEARLNNLKEKSLKTSIYEGSAASVSSGFGDSYITPFALALNAQPIHIGFISSLSGLASPLAQFFGSRMMAKYSRKRIVLTFVLLQAIMWLPIALLGILYWKGFFQTSSPIILISLYTILASLGGVAYPAWFSWMGDLVPEDQRGKYFSKRNTATGLVGLATVLIGAFIIDVWKTQGLLLIGFASFFALAFTFKFISFLIFHRQYAPPIKIRESSYFSLWAFLKRYDNFGKFAIYQAVFYFTLMIASPFFIVYMAKDLGFSPIIYMTITISSSAFYLIFMPLMGKFSDKYGNLRLMYFSNFIFVLSPLLWLVFTSPVWLTLVQVVAGIANAAYVISFVNFTYGAVSPEKRAICIAYTNILIGVGVFLGSIVGGAIVNYGNITFMNPFLFIFALSSALRLVTAIIFLPLLKDEDRFERHHPYMVMLAHPFKLVHAETGLIKSFFSKK